MPEARPTSISRSRWATVHLKTLIAHSSSAPTDGGTRDLADNQLPNPRSHKDFGASGPSTTSPVPKPSGSIRAARILPPSGDGAEAAAIHALRNTLANAPAGLCCADLRFPWKPQIAITKGPLPDRIGPRTDRSVSRAAAAQRDQRPPRAARSGDGALDDAGVDLAGCRQLRHETAHAFGSGGECSRRAWASKMPMLLTRTSTSGWAAMPLRTTRAFSRASRTAAAKPMPAVDPVMSARLPASPKSVAQS